MQTERPTLPPSIVTPDAREFPLTRIDLEFPPYVFKDADPDDVPMLSKIAMCIGAISWETLRSTVRSLAKVQLNEDSTEYTISVRMPADHVIDFDAAMAVWNAAPTNFVALVIGPWKDSETGVVYLNVNAVVRRTRQPMSGRFLMLQHMRRELAVSRGAFSAAQTGHRTRALLLKQEEAAEHNAHARTPWLTVVNPIDRETVQSVVMLCKDMATNTSGDVFWRNIRVLENLPGQADRIVVVWRLPENTLVDALIGATLRIRHPQAIDTIRFRLDGDAPKTAFWLPVVVEIVLYSVSCDLVRVADTKTINIFTNMHNRASQASVVQICGPSASPQAKEKIDPVSAAEATIDDGRVSAVKRRSRSFSYDDDEKEVLSRPAKVQNSNVNIDQQMLIPTSLNKTAESPPVRHLPTINLGFISTVRQAIGF